MGALSDDDINKLLGPEGEQLGQQRELDRKASRDAIKRRAIPGAVLLVVGIVIGLVPGHGTYGTAAAGFLIGSALIWWIAQVFYEIGLGEDRDRAHGGHGPYDRIDPRDLMDGSAQRQAAREAEEERRRRGDL